MSSKELPDSPNKGPEERLSGFYWYRRGMRHLTSTPALVLCASFLGFGGFARESGIELAHAMFMTPSVWALPSKVILVSGIVAEASLLAIALAVALASVRFMPMIVAFVPEVRDEDTPTWQLLVLAHVTAVTSWVFGMTHLRAIPRYARVPFFAGFAISLTTINIGVTALGYGIAGLVPPLVAAALFMTTPLYFMLTLPSAARMLSDRLALVFGFALGPLFALVVPGSDLVLTGLVGGILAYGVGYLRRRG